MKKFRILPTLIICLALIMVTSCEVKSVSPDTSIKSIPTSTSAAVTDIAVIESPTILPTEGSISIPDMFFNSAFDFSQNLVVLPVTGTYQFTEGPFATSDGSVYFSDINAGRIYKWSPDGNVVVYIEGINSPNGLAIDGNNNLIVCEGGNGRVISISTQGEVDVVADQYDGVRFNEPNDLWIDPQGGIYFTDPAYNSAVVQPGEDVYYVTPDRSQVIRVIDNLVKPNGIVGTADGLTLYVADWGAGNTYSYTINPDGSLSNAQVFIESGSDGMTLDQSGNLYLTTTNKIRVFDSTGNLLKEIPMAENPTNLELAGNDQTTLFVTARTSVYTIQLMKVEQTATQEFNTSGFTLTSPDIAEGGALPTEYTCDGVSSTLALNWSGAPVETKSYAVLMDHIASPTDIHWYWILYNIPANTTSLAKNSKSVGTLGTNSVNNRLEYAPPCSKGPGFKTYTYTVFALSDEPQFNMSAEQVNREVFLSAIQGITLANAKLNVIYSRP